MQLIWGDLCNENGGTIQFLFGNHSYETPVSDILKVLYINVASFMYILCRIDITGI